ncbi:hypothetical protein E0Z10_g8614 [Xylaria hypoxylon]|uniref:Cyanovirin-N domain-containing protein n=1 Tax=Xylaria hypoxylon TaxID=37992 RepID=A0A4Z0YL53_9PEZI|nr:hypothetical protein E0Z10_g8614 [Xylaria hypoxylon]
MLPTNILSTVGACALLVSSALGAEIKAKKYSDNVCGDGGGPTRSYTASGCFQLFDSDNSIKISSRSPSSCVMKTYKSDDCSGPAMVIGSGCVRLNNQNSGRVTC